MNKKYEPKWRRFTVKELHTPGIEYKPLFGKPYTLRYIGGKVIDGYRKKGTITS